MKKYLIFLLVVAFAASMSIIGIGCKEAAEEAVVEEAAVTTGIEGKKVDYHTAVQDLFSLSKGKIVGLPPYDK